MLRQCCDAVATPVRPRQRIMGASDPANQIPQTVSLIAGRMGVPLIIGIVMGIVFGAGAEERRTYRGDSGRCAAVLTARISAGKAWIALDGAYSVDCLDRRNEL